MLTQFFRASQLKRTTNMIKATSCFHVKSTVDVNETEHFKQFSAIWWDPNGPMKPLHAMNAIRIPLIKNRLTKAEANASRKPLKDMRLLEVGCGAGILTEALAKLGTTIDGVDATEDLINYASIRTRSVPNIKYYASSIEDYAANNPEKYDLVIVSEVIEHVNEKDAFLEACVKCIKPGGSILITTFNRTYAAWLVYILLAEVMFNVIPRGSHNLDKFISPEGVRKLLEKHGCKTIEIKGLFFDFIRYKWLWVNNTLFSYSLEAIKSAD